MCVSIVMELKGAYESAQIMLKGAHPWDNYFYSLRDCKKDHEFNFLEPLLFVHSEIFPC